MIMEENMVVIRDPKTFCFNFDSSAENKFKKRDWTIIVKT